MVDSNFYTTVIGACKRVISGIVTDHYAFSGTKLHEEKTSERLMKELEAKIDLENRNFQHKIILNNRKYIPNATRTILKAINQLFVQKNWSLTTQVQVKQVHIQILYLVIQSVIK